MRTGKYAGTFGGSMTIVVALFPMSAKSRGAKENISSYYQASCVIGLRAHGAWEQTTRVHRLDTAWLQMGAGFGKGGSSGNEFLPKEICRMHLKNHIRGDWKSFNSGTHANDNVPEGEYGDDCGCLTSAGG